MLLAIDCETTTLPKKYAPIDHPTQPHLVELGAVLAEDDGTERAAMSFIVAPEEGWNMAPEALAAHGITAEIAARAGVTALNALGALSWLRARADTIIAFNMEFDAAILRTAMARAALAPGASIRYECVMRLAAPILNLPPTDKQRAAGFKRKNPSLAETHQYLFGCGFEGAHGALQDSRIALKCYIELKKRNGNAVM